MATKADKEAINAQSISGKPLPLKRSARILETLAPSRSSSPSMSMKPLPSLSKRTKYSPAAKPPTDSATVIFSRYSPASSLTVTSVSVPTGTSSSGFRSTSIRLTTAVSSATNFGSTTSNTPSPSQSSPASRIPFPFMSSTRSTGTVPTLTNPEKISVQVPTLLQPIAKINRKPMTVTILKPITHFNAT